MKSEAVILCEGYYDRAFLDGWLRHLGCAEARTDPWNKPVRRGQYGYSTPHEHFVRITPCAGKFNVLPWARQRLDGRQLEPVTTLVVCVDRDDRADGSPAPKGAITEAAVESLVAKLDPSFDSSRPGSYLIDDGAVQIAHMPWWTPDPPHVTLPHQQTLERLACAALAAVYPERAEAVAAWLAQRPDAPSQPDPKDHTWSYLAGWYAGLGCEAFFKCHWDDPRVVEELRRRLEEIGAWNVVGALLDYGDDASGK